METGATISMISPTDGHTLKSTLFKLKVTNGSHIETYGTKILNLNIGIQHDFTWSFTQVNVRTPILEADFIAFFNLVAHMNMRTI